MQSNKEQAKLVLSVTDLTSLNLNDTNQTIDTLCEKAISGLGKSAAVCCYPKFITHVKTKLSQLATQFDTKPIKVATVINFPTGAEPFEDVISQVKESVSYLVDEIDLVYPYQDLLNDPTGDQAYAIKLISAVKEICKLACHKVQLKVIIESGELAQANLIEIASRVSIEAGADFIKTSTGKTPVSATLEAAKVMLQTIVKLNSSCGFKASGGISTVKEAMKYVELAKDINGIDFVSSDTFRFGASGIYNDIAAILNGVVNNLQNSEY